MNGNVIKVPITKFRLGQEFNNNSKGISTVSSFKYVEKLRTILSDELFSRLEESFLGPIIKAASRINGGRQKKNEAGLGFSGQLVHFLLCRQVITPRANEIWFHFAGQLMRFSLREFYMVTGLPCEETDPEDEAEHFEWPLCEAKEHGFDDLVNQIMALPEEAQEGKLRLAMLLILESVFLMPYSDKKKKLSVEYVNLAKQRMRTYSWGKKSFEILLDSLKYVSDEKLVQGKYTLKGYPQALHLWLLASVPKIESHFAEMGNSSEDFICARYLRTSLPTHRDIQNIEDSANVEVTCVLRSNADLASLVTEYNDNLKSIMELAKRGYRLEIYSLTCFKNDKGDSVLHLAAAWGHLELVKIIVSKCPCLLLEPNSKDQLPLHVAARDGHSAVVEAFVATLTYVFSSNERLNLYVVKDKDEHTPLHLALKGRYMKIASSLVNADQQGLSFYYSWS